MGYVVLALLLIAGAAFAVAAQRRSHRSRNRSDVSDLDAEVEASGWVLRLGASLSAPEAHIWSDAGEPATRALTAAAECHRTATTRLSEAHTPAEYAEATRAAKEGLAHVATARAALENRPALADSAA